MFIYGHTHKVTLDIENGRAIINTGTWLKKLSRIPARIRFFPAVYYLSYALNTFKLYGVGHQIVIECLTQEKKDEQNDLTLMQKLMT